MALFLSLVSVAMFIISIVKFIGRKKKNIPLRTPILLLVGSLALFTFSTAMSNKEIRQAEKEELERANIEREEGKENQAKIDAQINKQKEEQTKKEEEKGKKYEQPDRKLEIEKVIQARIDDGDYKRVKLDKITINDNLGTDTEDDYIALVYFKFQVTNSEKTGNTMMRKYSDDLAATLANKGIEDVAEIAVFWEDEYNKRDLKYAYEYRDGGFFVMDVAGE